MSVKVSVGIAVYNVQDYIEKCARSLFSQTLQEVEFVFVDDCSQDDSIKILRQTLADYPQRQAQVKIVAHSLNKGPMRARKTAMAEFTGKYMIFCDSDDWIEPDMLLKMYEKAEKTSADVVHCGYNIWYTDKKIKRNCEIADVCDYKTFMKMIYQADISPFLVVFMFKRSALQCRNFYLPDWLFFSEDLLLIIQMLRQCRSVACCTEGLYYYNRREGSLSHSSALRKMLNLRHVLRYIYQSEKDPELQGALKVRYFYFMLFALRHKLLQKRDITVLKHYFSAFEALKCRSLKFKKRMQIFAAMTVMCFCCR